MKTFKARYEKGHIEPREPVDFREGADLIVTAREASESVGTAEEEAREALEEFRATIGALKDIDVEARIAALYRARKEGTRPP